jgi:hypothetical protein
LPAELPNKPAQNGARPSAAKNGRELACPVCGAAISNGQPGCGECGWMRAAPSPARLKPGPLPPREYVLRQQFDRLLVLAAILAFASLYLAWLPGLYEPIEGWKVSYATPNMPLDELRHLEMVARPESVLLLNVVGFLALLFCRTSRHAGVRDLVACVLLVAGGGYLLIYFAHEWGWCLPYNYVGAYAGFLALGLVVASGLLRTKFMPWIAQSRAFLLVASAFLLTGFFLPWSLDRNGVQLMVVAQDFYWLGVPRIYAYLMLVFPLLGFVGFIATFRPVPKSTNFVVRLWPLFLGLAALVYFRTVWATYLAGFPLGSWGILAGLTILTAAGILDISPSRPLIGKFLAWAFFAASFAAWLSFLTGGLGGIFAQFPGFTPPITF